MTRLARMADLIDFRAPFAELALAQPKLPPETADELREAIIRGRE